jgi:hypothetical protein
MASGDGSAARINEIAPSPVSRSYSLINRLNRHHKTCCLMPRGIDDREHLWPRGVRCLVTLCFWCRHSDFYLYVDVGHRSLGDVALMQNNEPTKKNETGACGGNWRAVRKSVELETR